jgi:hypothetical protein
VQKRAEVKGYLDIDALLRHGVDLTTALAAGSIVCGRGFNPFITHKAPSYFDGLPALPPEVRWRLSRAVQAADPARLPELTPYAGRPGEAGCSR